MLVWCYGVSLFSHKMGDGLENYYEDFCILFARDPQTNKINKNLNFWRKWKYTVLIYHTYKWVTGSLVVPIPDSV